MSSDGLARPTFCFTDGHWSTISTKRRSMFIPKVPSMARDRLQGRSLQHQARRRLNVLQTAIAAECWTSNPRVSTSPSASGRASAPYGHSQKDSSQFVAQVPNAGPDAARTTTLKRCSFREGVLAAYGFGRG